MNQKRAYLIMLLIFSSISAVVAQQSVVSAGGDFSGTGGTMSSSSGQTDFEYYESLSRNLQFGTQQIFGNENQTIKIDVFPIEGGDVYGEGSYVVGSLVTLYAQPKPGYVFIGWEGNFTPAGGQKSIRHSDENPIVIKILIDTYIVAKFIPLHANVPLSNYGIIVGILLIVGFVCVRFWLS